MVHMRLAGLDAFELDYKGCLKHSRRAVEIAERADADYERVWATGFLALGLLDSGDHRHGFEVMDACFDEAVEKGYWVIANNMTFNDVWTRTHMLEGDLEVRLERFGRMPPMRPNEAGSHILTSYVALARGDLGLAEEAGERALAAYEDLGFGKMVWRCRVQLAAVLTELGRDQEAEEVLPPISARTELQDIVYDATAQVRTRLARGETEDALSVAREIVERADGLSSYRIALAAAAEALVAGGELDAVETLIERGAARETTAGQSYLDEMRGRVLLARGDAASAEPVLAGAIAAAEEVGYPLVALRRRILRAEALHDSDAAERELGSVAEEADRLGAALVRSEAEAAGARLGVALPVGVDVPAPMPEPTQIPIGERLVTSLFADVRGYTKLAGDLSPEELTERMTALYRFARAAVSRNHGIIDKFAGDAVMATFNVSGTRIDHCVDALEAALALRDKARMIDLTLGVGIATGPAVLGPGATEENVAVRGESTNLAARLQSAAGGGEILLSEEAHRRVERRLAELELRTAREELDVKGLDGPVIAHRIDAPVAART
jgi:class 3 adenylate cyclase